MSTKRDHSRELQLVVSDGLPAIHLLRLKMVNKQWRSEITVRMVIDALSREIPNLIGLPLDQPFGFYMEVVRSYEAKCKMSRNVVFHLVGSEATSNLEVKMQQLGRPGEQPDIAAEILVERLGTVLHTREGRSFVVEAVLEWRSLARTRAHRLSFFDGATQFLDTLEWLMHNRFVILGRRITIGKHRVHW